MSSEPAALGWWARLWRITAGLGATTIGVALISLLLGSFQRLGQFGAKVPVQGWVAGALAVALAGAMVVIGLTRVVHGVRGRASPRSERSKSAEAWVRRNWYLGSLVVWGGFVCFAWATSANFAEAVFRGEPVAAGPWFLVAALLLVPAHVVVHELGHAFAGALVGFRFMSIRVGWLTVSRRGERLTSSWSRPSSTELLGFHAATPSSADGLWWKRALYAAAGPTSSVLAGLAFWLGARAVPSTVESSLWSRALGAGAWVGFGLGALNLVPFRTKSGFATDGLTVLDSLRPQTPATAAAYRFAALSAQAARPRQWALGADFFLSVAELDPRHRDTLYLAGATVALDVGDRALAGQALKQALEGSGSGPMRFELELQAVMLDALEGRAGEARARLARLGPHPTMADYPLLARAVVSAAEGRLTDAAAELQGWERALEATGQAGVVRMGNDWAVEALEAKLATAAQGSSSLTVNV